MRKFDFRFSYSDYFFNMSPSLTGQSFSRPILENELYFSLQIVETKNDVRA